MPDFTADFGKMHTDDQVKLLQFATIRHEPVKGAVMCRSIILVIGGWHSS